MKAVVTDNTRTFIKYKFNDGVEYVAQVKRRHKKDKGWFLCRFLLDNETLWVHLTEETRGETWRFCEDVDSVTREAANDIECLEGPQHPTRGKTQKTMVPKRPKGKATKASASKRTRIGLRVADPKAKTEARRVRRRAPATAHAKQNTLRLDNLTPQRKPKPAKTWEEWQNMQLAKYEHNHRTCPCELYELNSQPEGGCILCSCTNVTTTNFYAYLERHAKRQAKWTLSVTKGLAPV